MTLSQGEQQRIDKIWTKGQFLSVCEHLHNGNGEHAFIIGFREKSGIVKYQRSKSKRVGVAASWAWASLNESTKSQIAIGFYSQNRFQKSRWGAIDFDSHDGDTDRARNYAEAAFHLLLQIPDIYIILETTGSSQGWHIFVIRKDFWPCDEWIKLLKVIVEKIGAKIEPGICEIFPPDSCRGTYGKPLRAPGTFNPKGGFSEIVFQNIDPIFSLYHATPLSCNQQSDAFLQLHDIKEQVCSLSTPPALSEGLKGMIDSLSSESRIVRVGSRNLQLTHLVGKAFNCLGRNFARKLAERQFEESTAFMNADKEQHLKDFDDCWKGLEKKWLDSLNQNERQVVDALASENERDAFRIVQSFEFSRLKKAEKDFPVGIATLGTRVLCTHQWGANMRAKLVKLGVISQTIPAKPNKSIARYIWTVTKMCR